MKTLLLCINLLCTSISCISQNIHENYLIVRIDKLYDNIKQRSYHVINADLLAEDADEVYGLLKYDNKKGAINDSAVYYTPGTVFHKQLLNYFGSTTECLNYLSKHGWSLLSVDTEISTANTSEWNRSEWTIMKNVSSRPVYYFVKRKKETP